MVAKVKKKYTAHGIGENYQKLYDAKSSYKYHFGKDLPSTYDDLGGVPKSMYEDKVKKGMAKTVKSAAQKFKDRVKK